MSEPLVADTVEIFRQLLETVLSTVTDTIDASDILDVLNGLREIYESTSTDKDKQLLVDLLVTDSPALPTLYGFISNIFSGMLASYAMCDVIPLSVCNLNPYKDLGINR